MSEQEKPMTEGIGQPGPGLNAGTSDLATSGQGGAPERAKAARLDGLAWLAARGRLTARQVQAGTRYGRLTKLAEGGDMVGYLALFEVRRIRPPLSAADAKVWAQAKLVEARAALGDHPGLIFALDQVCALGKRPREVTTDERAAARLEDRLGVGLDLLVRAWGL